MRRTPDPFSYVKNIRKSGFTIYDPIEIGDLDLWIPASALESLLDASLSGLRFTGLPIRTRSKAIKTEVCKALGYPVPKRFAKTQPRFPGQLFDTYGQKSNNLQVWNEELFPTRRYVLIRLSDADVVQRVKVVTGATLSQLDTTGTLTQKYQARLICRDKTAELISAVDTDIASLALNSAAVLRDISPTADPVIGDMLPISQLFDRLCSLLGVSFPDRGHDQERRRGTDLHRLVCKSLGYSTFADDGRFPDIRNQLLEIKLQTSPTIDLGLVCPNSRDPLDMPKIQGSQLRHCDVRYALFYATTNRNTVSITHFFLTTGEAFFSRFPQFRGKVLNKKLQIPLPADFFG